MLRRSRATYAALPGLGFASRVVGEASAGAAAVASAARSAAVTTRRRCILTGSTRPAHVLPCPSLAPSPT
ncbi:MAG TPA: hypothetical protein VHC43_10200 [Mycobacteriales bacterium]|nr:hypothetical protein [Mycobacteriales bacterium]